ILRLVVTDRGGLSDSSSVTIFPETDLTPSTISAIPAIPTGVGSTRVWFAIRNPGRMSAPYSRWRLLIDGALAAEGDTLVGALDSVTVTRVLPSPSAGRHAWRVVADTLGTVTETDETNNAITQSWGAPRFPSSTVLDGFERADGPLAPAWSG